MTLNIDGFRSKREDFVNMIERFDARSGRKLSVIGLCETKLGDAEAPDVPGFRVVARRDRAANDGGGGVAVLVRDSYAARALDGPPDDASETLAVALGEGDRAPRFFVGYRAPDDDMEPYLRALRFHASEAAAAGAAFVGGGDPNLPALQLPQSGVDLRACSGATETAGCRAFRTLLEESRLTVKSGTVAACGPDLDAALTHYRNTTATRP